MGTPQSQDVLFYQNPTQPKRFYEVSVNEEETLMYLYEAGAGAGNNLFVRDLRQQGSQFIQLTDNMDFQYMPIYNEGDKIYIYTKSGIIFISYLELLYSALKSFFFFFSLPIILSKDIILI